MLYICDKRGSFHKDLPEVGDLGMGVVASQVALVVKSPPAKAGDLRGTGSIPWRRAWQSTPVFLPGESHGQRSLAGYTVHGVSKSLTRLKQLSTQARTWWERGEFGKPRVTIGLKPNSP